MSRTEPLTGLEERLVAEAEADLQRLLSIEPSPEFAVKVRARIDETHERRGPRWGWIGLAIATAAALILAALLRTDYGVPPDQPTEIVRRPDTILHPDSPPDRALLPATTGASLPVATAKGSARTAEAAPRPEIIIDPAMTAAIRRMAMSLTNAEPDASTAEQLQIQTGEPAPLAIAEPLNVPELVLKPADQTGGN